LLGLKCAIRLDIRNGLYPTFIETKSLVVGADEYLVAESGFDLSSEATHGLRGAFPLRGARRVLSSLPNRACKPMILLPGKRDGQIASLIGEAQEVH
jgi:hypothetical protein